MWCDPLCGGLPPQPQNQKNGKKILEWLCSLRAGGLFPSLVGSPPSSRAFSHHLHDCCSGDRNSLASAGENGGRREREEMRRAPRAAYGSSRLPTPCFPPSPACLSLLPTTLAGGSAHNNPTPQFRGWAAKAQAGGVFWRAGVPRPSFFRVIWLPVIIK